MPRGVTAPDLMPTDGIVFDFGASNAKSED
jgi:hypothetical protein